jgi:hypothetical protein
MQPYPSENLCIDCIRSTWVASDKFTENQLLIYLNDLSIEVIFPWQTLHRYPKIHWSDPPSRNACQKPQQVQGCLASKP